MLGRDPEQLAYLEQLPLADLRELRERVTEVLWSARRQHPEPPGRRQQAAAGRGQRGDQRAGLRAPAVGAAGRHCSSRRAPSTSPPSSRPPFLADVAVELDPRRASRGDRPHPAATRSPRSRASSSQREEYVTMGRFVGHLSDEAVAAALGETDDRSLLRVAFVLEEKESPRATWSGCCPSRGWPRSSQTAADDELWLEALDLLEHLSDGRRSAIVAAALELDDHATQETIIAAVLEHDLWNEVLVIAEHDRGLQEKLAARLDSLSPAQRREVAPRAGGGAIDRLGVLGEALERA